MPTNLIRSHSQFTASPEILASEIGLRAPRMLTLDQSYFSGSPVVLNPGTIICKLPSGKGRAYPAAKATAAVATSAKVIPVADATLYKVGDVLTKSTGEALGTVASIDVAGNAITLAANTTTAIAVDDRIVGNTASVGEPYGIIISLIDITDTSNDVACYTSASVFAARLPYWDTAMQAKFPEITLVDPVVP